MAQRKDSPNTPTEGGSKEAALTGGGNSKSAAKGGGRSDSRSARAATDRNSTVRREKASPSGRNRGETSVADRT